MNGQKRPRLFVLTVSVILLLSGSMACNFKPSAEQVIITTAENLTVTLQKSQYSKLGKAFHESAERATLSTEKMVTHDLALRIKRQPGILTARNTFPDQERG